MYSTKLDIPQLSRKPLICVPTAPVLLWGVREGFDSIDVMQETGFRAEHQLPRFSPRDGLDVDQPDRRTGPQDFTEVAKFRVCNAAFHHVPAPVPRNVLDAVACHASDGRWRVRYDERDVLTTGGLLCEDAYEPTRTKLVNIFVSSAIEVEGDAKAFFFRLCTPWYNSRIIAASFCMSRSSRRSAIEVVDD